MKSLKPLGVSQETQPRLERKECLSAGCAASVLPWLGKCRKGPSLILFRAHSAEALQPQRKNQFPIPDSVSEVSGPLLDVDLQNRV